MVLHHFQPFGHVFLHFGRGGTVQGFHIQHGWQVALLQRHRFYKIGSLLFAAFVGYKKMIGAPRQLIVFCLAPVALKFGIGIANTFGSFHKGKAQPDVFFLHLLYHGPVNAFLVLAYINAVYGKIVGHLYAKTGVEREIVFEVGVEIATDFIEEKIAQQCPHKYEHSNGKAPELDISFFGHLRASCAANLLEINGRAGKNLGFNDLLWLLYFRWTMKEKAKTSKLVVAAIVVGSLFGLFIVGRLTGAIQWYHITAQGNEPTLNKADWVWATNLKKPALHSFIMFSRYDSVAGSNQILTYRCMGTPGDKLEMRNGTMYINGKNEDTGFEQKKYYVLYAANTKPLLATINFKEDEYMPPPTDTVALVALANTEYKTIKAACKLPGDSIIAYKFEPMENQYGGFLYHQGNGKWDLDNFGPIKVPEGNYFVLGDYRHNAMDSRFTGFVVKEAIAGVVFNR
jgi:signal peptidase I